MENNNPAAIIAEIINTILASNILWDNYELDIFGSLNILYDINIGTRALKI